MKISAFAAMVIAIAYTFFDIYAPINVAYASAPSQKTASQAPPEPLELLFETLDTKAHNRHSFTQGLIRSEDYLIESSGLYRKSFLYRYHINTGKIDKTFHFSPTVFAEGIALYNHKIYALSWKAQTAFVINPKTFLPMEQIRYAGEGWGLTVYNDQLVMSNGSDKLQFLQPETFKVNRIVHVKSNTKKIWRHLNELEFALGYIWANVWQSTIIIAIDPDNGHVIGTADMSNLVKKNSHKPGYDVLNGIAFNSEDNSFWVTGKLWAKRYKIRFTQGFFNKAKPTTLK